MSLSTARGGEGETGAGSSFASSAPQNRVAATISTVVYAGAALTYTAEALGMTFKIFAQNRDARPHAVGAPVTLSWSPEHTVLVEDEA